LSAAISDGGYTASVSALNIWMFRHDSISLANTSVRFDIRCCCMWFALAWS